MTKLKYNKAPYPDPARVIGVRESGIWSGNDAHPFETDIQRKERYAKERKAKAAERKAKAAKSKRIRLNAIIKKYGIDRASDFGVPKSFIEAKIAARAKAKRDYDRAQRKRERRAARSSDEHKT